MATNTPVWVVVDCGGGASISTPLTPDEITAKSAAAAATVAAQQKADAARAALVANVQASKDPAMQALIQLLGIQ